MKINVGLQNLFNKRMNELCSGLEKELNDKGVVINTFIYDDLYKKLRHPYDQAIFFNLYTELRGINWYDVRNLNL